MPSFSVDEVGIEFSHPITMGCNCGILILRNTKGRFSLESSVISPTGLSITPWFLSTIVALGGVGTLLPSPEVSSASTLAVHKRQCDNIAA